MNSKEILYDTTVKTVNLIECVKQLHLETELDKKKIYRMGLLVKQIADVLRELEEEIRINDSVGD